MVATMHFVINYEPLKILRVYEGTCFGHVMSKACQYATNDDKIYVGLRNVSERNSEWVTKNYYMDLKVQEREARMGTSLF